MTTDIESHIESDFNGADGESVYELTNGQKWEQSRYMYHYHYAYRPKVRIAQEGSGFVMYVQGMSSGIPVRRIE
jgi:hypothetical protein